MAKPMYQQIAEDLWKQIDSGALERGSRLPTELELREKYNASRNTIRDAIKRLTSQGLVETRPGQGTYVTVKADPFVTVLTTPPGLGEGVSFLSQVSARHRRPYATTPKVEVQTPPEVVTKRLRVPPGTQTVSRHEAQYIDGIPYSLRTSFYPMEFVTRGATRLLMAEDITEGAVRYLADEIGLTQVGHRDWITARSPDDTEQKFFGISHDATVFEKFRTAFDQYKAPMRVTVEVYPADRNQFIVDVGDSLPEPQYD